MPLYLIRHAEAVDGFDLQDESRFLTPRGRADARRLGESLARQRIVPSAIVSSPLVRAVQTAELIAAVLAPDVDISIHEALSPSGARHGLLPPDLASLDDTLLVGHEPSISAFANGLVGRQTFHGFRKAQVACIAEGSALWWLMPGDESVRPIEG